MARWPSSLRWVTSRRSIDHSMINSSSQLCASLRGVPYLWFFNIVWDDLASCSVGSDLTHVPLPWPRPFVCNQENRFFTTSYHTAWFTLRIWLKLMSIAIELFMSVDCFSFSFCLPTDPIGPMGTVNIGLARGWICFSSDKTWFFFSSDAGLCVGPPHVRDDCR